MANWAALANGETLAYKGTLEDWGRPVAASPGLHVADYVFPLVDGSRLHARVYENGDIWVHRDRFDPGKGPLHAIAHLATEAPMGKIAIGAIGTIVGAAAVAIWRSK